MAQPTVGPVFMSYSRRDEAVMHRIVTYLREQGINVWVDNEKLVPGTPIWEVEIEKAIRKAGAIVILLSPDSNQSVWVRREISFAERYQKRIFPVLVAGDEDSSITLRLITSQYADIRTNQKQGLTSLCSAISKYLGNQEIQKENVNGLQKRNRFNNKDKKQSQLQKPAQVLESRKKDFYPRWIAVFWLTLGWAISWEMGWRIAIQIFEITRWDLVPFGFTLAFAFGGLVTAVTLRVEHVLSNWKSLLTIILGWTMGGAIGGLSGQVIITIMEGEPLQDTFWVIIMLGMFFVGSLITSIVLRRENILKNWNSMLGVVLAWVASEALNRSLETIVGGTYSPIIRGAISGGISGVIMIYIIRKSQR